MKLKIVQITTDNRGLFAKDENEPLWFGMAPEALFSGFALLPDVELHVVSCARHRMKSPDKLADNTWFHSLHVPKLGWMRTFYQGCIRAVRKKLREIQPDIVHGQGTEMDCALGAVFSGYPNVVTIHGNMAELARLLKARPCSFGWFAGHFENLALRRTDGVFCNSAYTEGLVKPRTRRTWRVPNAIRLDFFAPPVATKPKTSKPILINVGLISPRKRQLELLDLATRLHEEGNAFELHFIGGASTTNSYGAAFLEKVRPLERAGIARYVGKKNTAELIRYFDQSQAMIHFPSEEAFGLVVAEALARNLKFFGARVGGMNDIASDIPGAEMFAAEDWSGLQTAIGRWLRVGAPQNQTTQAIIASRYHPKQIAQRHIEVYRDVLGRSL